VAFLETKLGPGFALGDTGIDILFYDRSTNSSRCLDTFAIIVEAVGYHSFSTIFVGSNGLWGKRGGIVEFFVVSPVWAAEKCISTLQDSGILKSILCDF